MPMKNDASRMKPVFICSPLRPVGENPREEVRENVMLAKQACNLAMMQGYIPFAPHLYFPQFLCERNPIERELGIRMGMEMLAHCSQLWVIGDRISEGMAREIKAAVEMGIPVACIEDPEWNMELFMEMLGEGDENDEQN